MGQNPPKANYQLGKKIFVTYITDKGKVSQYIKISYKPIRINATAEEKHGQMI